MSSACHTAVSTGRLLLMGCKHRTMDVSQGELTGNIPAGHSKSSARAGNYNHRATIITIKIALLLLLGSYTSVSVPH